VPQQTQPLPLIASPLIASRVLTCDFMIRIRKLILKRHDVAGLS
jgi:hypothetical protein